MNQLEMTAAKKRKKKPTQSEEASPEPKPTKACQIKEDWEPTPNEANQRNEAGLRDRQWELDQFRDYHLARGSLMKNWDAAWRTWCRNSKKWDTIRFRFGESSTFEPTARHRAFAERHGLDLAGILKRLSAALSWQERSVADQNELLGRELARSAKGRQ